MLFRSVVITEFQSIKQTPRFNEIVQSSHYKALFKQEEHQLSIKPIRSDRLMEIKNIETKNVSLNDMIR